jgi:2-oxoisovalerate dehydrogenase E1 component alpha subunit
MGRFSTVHAAEPARRKETGGRSAQIAPMAEAISSPAFERYGLSDDQLRWMLRNMYLQRTLDNRGFQLNRQGKIPFATGSEGHEGIHAGAALAFERGRDILVPYYRDIGLAIGIGFEPIKTLLSMFARAADISGGRQFPNHYSDKSVGLMSISSIIAAHCPHAVGAAYAIKFRNESGRAVLCTFGDGSTSEGEWHESVNFAAVHRLPIVFLCENNEWAISTPRSSQMAIADVVQKADGYGIPGVIVDGSDPVESYRVVHEALERARTGGGPTLVEAKCYRFLAHTTDDDDRTYRTREEIESHRHLDPVPRFENFLRDHGIVDSDAIAALKKEVLAEVNDLTDRAEAMPYPSAEDLYTNVYEGTYEPWL